MVLSTVLLSKYYCKLTKFGDFLSALSLHPSSSLSHLTDSIWIGTLHDVKLLPDEYTFESVFSMDDILHRCIESLCKRNHTNIITRGYTFIREGYERSCISGSNCIQSKAPNTTVAYLKTRSWFSLHKVLGDDLMVYLLMNTSMYLSVENNCFVQLCGTPLMDLQISECVRTMNCTERFRTKKLPLTGLKRKRRESNMSQTAKKQKVEQPTNKATEELRNKVESPKDGRNIQGTSETCLSNHKVQKDLKRACRTPVSRTRYRKLIPLKYTKASAVFKRKKPFLINKQSNESQLNPSENLTMINEKLGRIGKIQTDARNMSKTNEMNPLRIENISKITAKRPKALAERAKKRRLRKEQEANLSYKPVIYLQRARIFYARSFLQGFHKDYILNRIESSNSGVHTLLNDIFAFDKTPGTVRRLPKYLLGLKELTKISIANFKKQKLRKILNFYCPIPEWSRKIPKKWLRKGGTQFQNKVFYKFAVCSFSPVQQVFLFVRYIILKTFPPLFWGSPANQKQFSKHLLKFLSLGRYENLSTNNIMSRIKVKHFKWLIPPKKEIRSTFRRHAQKMKKEFKIVQTFFVWIFNRFVVPVIRGCFYVTESSCHKNKVFFYRKPIWRIIRGLGLKTLIGNLFRPIDAKSVEEKLITGECLGIHQIRLLPGQKKLRPIANMTRCSNTTDMTKIKSLFSINEKLQALHLALHFENTRNRKYLGASVSSNDQIYERWKRFVDHCKNSHTSLPPIYFVTLDISRCFDTLPQDQILQLLPSCLQEESYRIKRFVKIKMSHSKHGISKKYVSMATEGTDCSNFITFIRNGLRKGTIMARNAVFVDKVYYGTETRQNMVDLLRKHLTCSIGYIGDRFLLQKTGVGQGSVLATILNNMHYGNIEAKNLLQFFHSQDSLLMRWVDDYLFVTTCRLSAMKFLEALHLKMPKYGCLINTKKTLVNFEVPDNRNKFTRLEGDWFPWCGYLFNCKTLECSVNYLHYIGERIGDSMKFNYASHPGLSMYRQLLLAVCLKASPLLCDGIINSKECVYKNVYQLFRFVSLKFLAHAKVLCKGRSITPHLSFYFRLVTKLPLKFWKVLCVNFKKSHYDHVINNASGEIVQDYRERVVLNRKIVKVLCLQAFIDTLRPRQTVFYNLIRLLVIQIEHFKEVSRELKIHSIRKNSKFLEMIKV